LSRQPLTPEQRSLRARIAAHTKHSLYDPVESTSKARSASPGSDAYWERQVDPDGVLPELERKRRGTSAKKAHFSRLAMASAKARRKGVADAS
jgi:hypothetical protein